MVNVIRIISKAVAVAVCFSVLSCTKDDMQDDKPLVPGETTIAGTWRLAEKNGVPVGDSPYVYIVFERSENKFTMYQNVNSGTSQCKTGTYSVTRDKSGNYVIDGMYDHDSGFWNSSYFITEFTADSMKWTVTDNADDVSVYKRCESVPEDILDGTKSM